MAASTMDVSAETDLLSTSALVNGIHNISLTTEEHPDSSFIKECSDKSDIMSSSHSTAEGIVTIGSPNELKTQPVKSGVKEPVEIKSILRERVLEKGDTVSSQNESSEILCDIKQEPPDEPDQAGRGKVLCEIYTADGGCVCTVNEKNPDKIKVPATMVSKTLSSGNGTPITDIEEGPRLIICETDSPETSYSCHRCGCLLTDNDASLRHQATCTGLTQQTGAMDTSGSGKESVQGKDSASTGKLFSVKADASHKNTPASCISYSITIKNEAHPDSNGLNTSLKFYPVNIQGSTSDNLVSVIKLIADRHGGYIDGAALEAIPFTPSGKQLKAHVHVGCFEANVPHISEILTDSVASLKWCAPFELLHHDPCDVTSPQALEKLVPCECSGCGKLVKRSFALHLRMCVRSRAAGAVPCQWCARVHRQHQLWTLLDSSPDDVPVIEAMANDEVMLDKFAAAKNPLLGGGKVAERRKSQDKSGNSNKTSDNSGVPVKLNMRHNRKRTHSTNSHVPKHIINIEPVVPKRQFIAVPAEPVEVEVHPNKSIVLSPLTSEPVVSDLRISNVFSVPEAEDMASPSHDNSPPSESTSSVINSCGLMDPIKQEHLPTSSAEVPSPVLKHGAVVQDLTAAFSECESKPVVLSDSPAPDDERSGFSGSPVPAACENTPPSSTGNLFLPNLMSTRPDCVTPKKEPHPECPLSVIVPCLVKQEDLVNDASKPKSPYPTSMCYVARELKATTAARELKATTASHGRKRILPREVIMSMDLKKPSKPANIESDEECKPAIDSPLKKRKSYKRCSGCKTEFSSEQDLIKHIQEKGNCHAKVPRRGTDVLYCKTCKMPFRRPILLKNHEATCSG